MVVSLLVEGERAWNAAEAHGNNSIHIASVRRTAVIFGQIPKRRLHKLERVI